MLLLIILYDFKDNLINIFIENHIILNKTNEDYYNSLFNSIEYDYYNISLIYNNLYNTIKIKHLTKKKNTSNSIVCILGILVNDAGLKIAKSMFNWLLPEYDVYCVYQKYPGFLFEYPALRFAQWLSLNFNEVNYFIYSY